MKITFLGAAHEVTGSCTLLEICSKKILVDCGMEQGADIYENCSLPVSASQIDCVLLTHAHIDHSGKIPMLTANGFSGQIYATGATVRLCNIMLMDSAHIQESEAKWRNRKAQRSGKQPYIPLYTINDVTNTIPLFSPCSYDVEYEIFDNIKIRFIDAGHLLGSASIEIKINENGIEKTLLFSGDVGNLDRPLIKNPQKPENADIVVIESTYGNRLHGERADYEKQLTDVLQQTFDRGGNVVIPSFAVGRTQELLYLINRIKRKESVVGHGDFPVWVDSPLAVEATRIYSGDMMEYYDRQTLELLKKGMKILEFKGLHLAVTSEESMSINNDKSPKVIISASGMCEAGRIRHHLKHNLWKKQSTILFVGYQTNGTMGRTLLDGAERVKIFGEEIAVNAHIAVMDGISGHADMNMLLDWLANLKTEPERVYVNHGGDTVCDEFAQQIESRLSFSATAPYNGAQYDLATGECINAGNSVKIEKRIHAVRGSSVFERLLLAGKRLMSVIEKNRFGANKDIAKFADQINELCGKWDR